MVRLGLVPLAVTVSPPALVVDVRLLFLIPALGLALVARSFLPLLGGSGCFPIDFNWGGDPVTLVDLFFGFDNERLLLEGSTE